ncbi:hypothetical protein ACWEP1_38170, partial [Streptomyces sp. NPDC004285]
MAAATGTAGRAVVLAGAAGGSAGAAAAVRVCCSVPAAAACFPCGSSVSRERSDNAAEAMRYTRTDCPRAAARALAD